VIRALAALFVLAACGGKSDVIPDSGPCVADLVPPGAAACPAPCTSCDNNICHIDCGQGACNDTTIECPADFACDITCNGLDACDTASVKCPTQYACTVSCTALDACGDLTLHCGVGTCSMTCNGPSDPCTGSLIDCALGGPCGAVCTAGSPAPSMDCRGACSCTPC